MIVFRLLGDQFDSYQFQNVLDTSFFSLLLEVERDTHWSSKAQTTQPAKRNVLLKCTHMKEYWIQNSFLLEAKSYYSTILEPKFVLSTCVLKLFNTRMICQLFDIFSIYRKRLSARTFFKYESMNHQENLWKKKLSGKLIKRYPGHFIPIMFREREREVSVCLPRSVYHRISVYFWWL